MVQSPRNFKEMSLTNIMFLENTRFWFKQRYPFKRLAFSFVIQPIRFQGFDRHYQKAAGGIFVHSQSSIILHVRLVVDVLSLLNYYDHAPTIALKL